MFSKNKPVLTLSVILALATLACSLAVANAPTPIVFPTPDLTLTAIYAVLGTLTVAPAQPTATASPLPPTIVPDTPTPTQPPAITVTPTSTSTPIPLSSPSPTPSPTLPTVRTSASVIATFFTSVPNIDGGFGDWNLPYNNVNHVTFGKEKWDNNADLSARVMVGWDNTYLYLAAQVTDEDYEQSAQGAELYMGDSLEVLLDTNLAADFFTKELSPDDFQLGVSPGRGAVGANTEAFLWFPSSISGARTNVLISVQGMDDGYNVEVAIPWVIFEISPQANQHYGFVFSISDNDKDGSILQQSMISNVPDRRLTNPMTWGDLLLKK
jgi:hypothetical protein